MWCTKRLLLIGCHFVKFVSGTCNLQFSVFLEFPFHCIDNLDGAEMCLLHNLNVKVEFTPEEIECFIWPQFVFENSICETEIQMASCSYQSNWKACKEDTVNETLYRKKNL